MKTTSPRQSSGATETWLRYRCSGLIQFKYNKTSENANKANKAEKFLKTSPHCLTVFCSA